MLKAGTRQYERTSGDLYEVGASHDQTIRLPGRTDGRRIQLAADLWRWALRDPAPHPRPQASDPRKTPQPIPHYHVQPRALSAQSVAMMTPALLDAMAGDLCECGRPADHPVHLVPERTPRTRT